MKRTLTCLALVGTLLVAADSRAYDSCTPDFDGWGWVPADQSMDDVMTAYWCGRPDAQAHADHYYNALQLYRVGSYWAQMVASEPLDCANPNTHLMRLYNAAASLEATWSNLNNATLPHQAESSYRWLTEFVQPLSDYGYTATCFCCSSPPCSNGCTKVATNPCCDDPTRLHFFFFWQSHAPVRASTLVHEATHEHVHHQPDEFCEAGGSCDDHYGKYNAQTMQIYFLDHAVHAYQKDEATGQLKVAEFGDGICGFLPFLSPATRLQASATMRRKLDFNFHPDASYFGPPSATYWATTDQQWDYGGNTWQVDQNQNARWDCNQICDPANYLPGGPRACNEDYQPGNATVNQDNYAACTTANGEVTGATPPAERAQVANAFYWSVKPCVPGVSDAYLGQYCSDLATSATNVGQIESGWDLPDQTGYFDSSAALMDCIKGYCHERFDPGWIQPARTACYEWSDPGYGCLDALCGDLAALPADSLAYFMAVQCRRHYVENAGSVSAYLDQQQAEGRCEAAYINCKNRTAYDDWTTAKADGACSLATYTVGAGWQPSDEDKYDLAAARDVGQISWSAYQQDHPAVPVDECMSVLTLCETLRDMAARIAAEYVAGATAPYATPNLTDKPNPTPYDRYRSPVDRNMGGLAAIAVSGSASGSYTPKQAARLLATTPEMLHSLSTAMGKETFFAAFGTKGLEPIFGATAAAHYASAQITVDPTAEPEVQAALAHLSTFKTTRERSESPATADLLADAATQLSQAQLYGFVEGLAGAQSPGEIEGVLDQMGAALP